MDWRDIPSLSALRALEAAVRNRSLSGAARELNVTHAAIAGHVRTLEARFGTALLVREGRAMVPTDAGSRLAAGLGEGFGAVADAVRALEDAQSQRPLRIATTPTLATHWLMPRIGDFWTAHPEIPVEILPSAELVDLRRDEVDLAIRYGRGDWPGSSSEPLMPARDVAVGAPSLVGRNPSGCLTDYHGFRWLFETRAAESETWAQAQGLDLDQVRITRLPLMILVLEAVRAGHGLTIMSEAIIDRDLADGTLIPICRSEQTDLAYHILTRPGFNPERVSIFRKWLKAQAKRG